MNWHALQLALCDGGGNIYTYTIMAHDTESAVYIHSIINQKQCNTSIHTIYKEPGKQQKI